MKHITPLALLSMAATTFLSGTLFGSRLNSTATAERFQLISPTDGRVLAELGSINDLPFLSLTNGADRQVSLQVQPDSIGLLVKDGDHAVSVAVLASGGVVATRNGDNLVTLTSDRLYWRFGGRRVYIGVDPVDGFYAFEEADPTLQ